MGSSKGRTSRKLKKVIDNKKLTEIIILSLQKGLLDTIGNRYNAITNRLIRKLSQKLSGIMTQEMGKEYYSLSSMDDIKNFLMKKLNILDNLEFKLEDISEDKKILRVSFSVCRFKEVDNLLTELTQERTIICPLTILIAALVREVEDVYEINYREFVPIEDEKCEILFELILKPKS